MTSLQVESSVSTYMMSLHLVSQGWTEGQIEEKLQAERKRQLEILSHKTEGSSIAPSLPQPLVGEPPFQSPAKSDTSDAEGPADDESLHAHEKGEAACSQNLADGNLDPTAVHDDGDLDSNVDADSEKEPRPSPEDSCLQGRKPLGSWRMSDMLTKMNNRLQAQGNSIVLRQFSRRTGAIHYLSQVMEDGVFAVTQSSPPAAETVDLAVRMGCVARRCAQNPPPPLLGTTRTTMCTRLQCLRVTVGVAISVLSPKQA